MAMIHVCSLARLHEVVLTTGARHIVTMLRDPNRMQRPMHIEPRNHLVLSMDDITEPLDGYTPPSEDHVARLVAFLNAWDRGAPLVMHCYAGISRSTASAFASVCALSPHREETRIAQALRLASPTATPNIRIVSLADRLLGRGGRMVAAIETIGRGLLAAEAEPFRLELE